MEDNIDEIIKKFNLAPIVEPEMTYVHDHEVKSPFEITNLKNDSIFSMISEADMFKFSVGLNEELKNSMPKLYDFEEDKSEIDIDEIIRLDPDLIKSKNIAELSADDLSADYMKELADLRDEDEILKDVIDQAFAINSELEKFQLHRDWTTGQYYNPNFMSPEADDLGHFDLTYNQNSEVDNFSGGWEPYL